jgi:hypothetical protein
VYPTDGTLASLKKKKNLHLADVLPKWQSRGLCPDGQRTQQLGLGSHDHMSATLRLAPPITIITLLIFKICDTKLFNILPQVLFNILPEG